MIYIVSLVKAPQEKCLDRINTILECRLNVRWLSLELPVDCSLKQYASLKSYFLNDEAPATVGISDIGGLEVH